MKLLVLISLIVLASCSSVVSSNRIGNRITTCYSDGSCETEVVRKEKN